MTALIVLDLEATCWERGTHPDRMETIEFGAVRLDRDTLDVRDSFERFVRPVDEPRLSAFCSELTGIEQAQVDGAAGFGEAIGDFVEWIGPEGGVLMTWGAYDLRQLRVDCDRHGLDLPAAFTGHVNLKAWVAGIHGWRPCGMKKALGRLGIGLEGRHHRGIDDARNIARILSTVARDHGLPDPEAIRR